MNDREIKKRIEDDPTVVFGIRGRGESPYGVGFA